MSTKTVAQRQILMTKPKFNRDDLFDFTYIEEQVELIKKLQEEVKRDREEAKAKALAESVEEKETTEEESETVIEETEELSTSKQEESDLDKEEVEEVEVVEDVEEVKEAEDFPVEEQGTLEKFAEISLSDLLESQLSVLQSIKHLLVEIENNTKKSRGWFFFKKD